DTHRDDDGAIHSSRVSRRRSGGSQLLLFAGGFARYAGSHGRAARPLRDDGRGEQHPAGKASVHSLQSVDAGGTRAVVAHPAARSGHLCSLVRGAALGPMIRSATPLTGEKAERIGVSRGGAFPAGLLGHAISRTDFAPSTARVVGFIEE